MQEIAEQFLNMANSIKGVTSIFVMILFFIIIIGVINTLRMTIRERTREIGTIRSIGMQRATVRSIFVTESLMLSFFASLGGIVIGWLIAFILSLVKIRTTSCIAMLLDGGHIHFVYSFGSTVMYVLLILLVTLVTAWIPSSKASKMSIANALRHYE
jgi:ABC-type antimicrobial peptide transport system permease subunit